jgi:hypothetical protein
MTPTTSDNKAAAARQVAAPVSRIRVLVSGLVLFAAGAGLSAWYFMRAPAAPPAAPVSAAPAALSDATVAVLQRLGSPVEIRFYSLLDPASVGDAGREFSGRVDELLSRYEQQGNGKIKIARISALAEANAAMADGITAFNMDKGDACYLGLTVVCGKQKETISSLSADWEPALESDLSRAIGRIIAASPQPTPVPAAKPANLEAVRRLIPNQDAVSADDGARLLHDASMAEVQRESETMEARVKEIEARFLQAQADHSDEGQEAALKEYQKIQAEHLVKLRQLATNGQAQISAWQQLKGGNQ